MKIKIIYTFAAHEIDISFIFTTLNFYEKNFYPFIDLFIFPQL